MALRPGDFVERRCGYGVARFGRIVGPIRRGHDSWYVSVADGITCCDYGSDLLPLLDAQPGRHPIR
ncbi:MAG TPA: hypothetical protein VHZ96_15740 [Frankiaceae bacterium]|jgi:hypothetical protein|nr:hypothetical protein [Frankiaceae bacterium]